VSDAFDLGGDVALVTGAARGIGRAIALGLAEAGANLALVDRAVMEDVAREVEALGRQARVYQLDVTDSGRIEPTFQQVIGDFGKLDILVNNAGTGINKPALEVTAEDWDRILDLNLKATFFCAQAAARHMVERGSGRIINIASTHALIAVPNGAPYIASKAGVAGLTRSLALEWTRFGVRVNAIAPGPVHTPMMQEMDALAGRTADDIARDMANRVPLGRRLQPNEIAGAAVFLASRAAQVAAGHILVMDGGQTIH
jgi:NAD(P)-dependent dehydrogenase (short-subunit alcohol dehydrogenase family)